MNRVLIVDVAMRVIFHTVLIGSLYLLFVGHNRPGGGFVGGLVAGAAIALRFIAGGLDEVRGLTRLQPWTILGTGLLVAAITAVALLWVIALWAIVSGLVTLMAAWRLRASTSAIICGRAIRPSTGGCGPARCSDTADARPPGRRR